MFQKNCSKASKSLPQYISLLLAFWTFACFSQNENSVDTLVSIYQSFAKLPREVAYAHLNKSTYIKGETLAFSAYIFDKDTKKLSNLTTNLYCTITDEAGKTIKDKLFLVNGGIAQGSFYVDSLFRSGDYTFKAYTNWMKNFDEQNFYIESIKVIDPEIESEIVTKVISSKLDAQFLPEGGHLLANTENTMGVVVKDTLGFGVPFVEGQILNSKDEFVTNFKTNEFGVTKFMFTPKEYEQYYALVNFEETQQRFKIDKAETYGVVLNLKQLINRVILRFATNERTFNSVEQKQFKLVMHNGNEIKSIDLAFNGKPEIIQIINHNDLFSGINIFTLFDENNQPLLERLLFKHEGINILETDEITLQKAQDSTIISISIKDIDANSSNSFSISILPDDTASYSHHHNIISSLYLGPYLKGPIENASYYFTNITWKKKVELDDLLMTQGWSSYNWNSIFNHSPNPIYSFETGLSFRATANDVGSGKFVLYPMLLNGLQTFDLSENNNTFEAIGLFPLDDETIKLAEILKNNTVKKSGIYAQFFPSKIPDLELDRTVLPIKEKTYFNSDISQPFLDTSWKALEQLDEVVISVNQEQERIEKIKNTSWGSVDFFDDSKRNAYLDFASYIQTKGFTVDQSRGEFRIYSRRGGRAIPPTVYIDDRMLLTLDELYYYRLDFIDYIVIDHSGFGEGLRGAGGVIKIYTDPLVSNKRSGRSVFQEIEIPLTFSNPTKFYTPKYSSYQSRFFKEYGVIDWFPNLSVDENGIITFKISNQSGSDIKLFIEGTANNGSLISEVKTVKLN